ncbi:hypothetical protein D3C72_2544120 [compost metagenome]
MRSPTLTVKSWVEPGVAAEPFRPRSEALLGRFFLLAQPASARVRAIARTAGLLANCCMRLFAGT